MRSVSILQDTIKDLERDIAELEERRKEKERQWKMNPNHWGFEEILFYIARDIARLKKAKSALQEIAKEE